MASKYSCHLYLLSELVEIRLSANPRLHIVQTRFAYLGTHSVRLMRPSSARTHMKLCTVIQARFKYPHLAGYAPRVSIPPYPSPPHHWLRRVLRLGDSPNTYSSACPRRQPTGPLKHKWKHLNNLQTTNCPYPLHGMSTPLKATGRNRHPCECRKRIPSSPPRRSAPPERQLVYRRRSASPIAPFPQL
jgi:hypothetical protein